MKYFLHLRRFIIPIFSWLLIGCTFKLAMVREGETLEIELKPIPQPADVVQVVTPETA